MNLNTNARKKQVVMSDAERKAVLRKRLYLILPFLSIGSFIAMWFIMSAKPGSLLPSPADVWARYLKFRAKGVLGMSLLTHTLISLRRVFIALFFAWTIGIAFGVLIGWNKKANALLGPIFHAFRAIPPLAWVPFLILMMGSNETSRVLLVFIGAVMPVVVNTQTGMANVNQQYLNVGKVFQANRRQMLLDIGFPSALDAIFAGIKNSTSAAWMVVLAAEMLGSTSGVGFLVFRGINASDYDLTLLGMVVIAIVGALLGIFIQSIERILCPWKKRSN